MDNGVVIRISDEGDWRTITALRESVKQYRKMGSKDFLNAIEKETAILNEYYQNISAANDNVAMPKAA